MLVNPTTTFITYGGFTTEQQFDAMDRLERRQADGADLPEGISADAIAKAVARKLNKELQS